ncbi:hypothetical protein BV22DRAFT_845167 [Leucogyrophana mollusca]|uniref:Uncharacterized protein n=1 Tax=Leucogyrophana mollusca TaxID=85980 RepID=A0ACB8B2Y9_9AGAM|nr:hypothetical protein BV22DRAFT_845167 [Leucogyrophana mollusca]
MQSIALENYARWKANAVVECARRIPKHSMPRVRLTTSMTLSIPWSRASVCRVVECFDRRGRYRSSVIPTAKGRQGPSTSFRSAAIAGYQVVFTMVLLEDDHTSRGVLLQTRRGTLRIPTSHEWRDIPAHARSVTSAHGPPTSLPSPFPRPPQSTKATRYIVPVSVCSARAAVLSGAEIGSTCGLITVCKRCLSDHLDRESARGPG